MLTFHLAGINNQNFLMRDEETGSFWQQITGAAISGPLAGKQLALVHSDELTFTLWKQEEPTGTVLADVQQFAPEYAPTDWAVKMRSMRTVIQNEEQGMQARDLVLGVSLGSDAGAASRAYLLEDLQHAVLVNDRVGGERVVLVTGSDRESVRVFRSGATDFYRLPDAAASDSEALMMDAATGSKWNFKGCAVAGPAKGQCLTPVDAIQDYWFDWRQYHAHTTIWRGR